MPVTIIDTKNTAADVMEAIEYIANKYWHKQYTQGKKLRTDKLPILFQQQLDCYMKGRESAFNQCKA